MGEHHSYQGSDYWDADIPTQWEGRIFSRWWTKLFWVLGQALFYAFRPLLAKPKKVSGLEILNWIVVVIFDFALINHWGRKSFAYLAMGSILGLGPHPIAGHFIAEHFEFVKGQETYSYYGPLNYLTYNVGYHNE